LIEPENEEISIIRQCELLDINRSGYYYQPCGESELNLEIMGMLDKQYTQTPFYGVERMLQYVLSCGYNVNIKRIRRLLRLMGLEAIYPKKKTSIKDQEHKVYPYLLKGLEINRPNQVWSSDITYIQMEKGFLYLVAIIDWFSRYVISWNISNTMDTGFCLDTLQIALERGKPEIFNTDQGSQFTSLDFTNCLHDNKVRISMDGKGRCLDNIFVERLWRTVKYEYVYLNTIKDGMELYKGLFDYFNFYNHNRFHQALNYKTPYIIHYQ
jgi:putative transposase